MSVAAMTMDDQRPLLNTYDKMSKQYEQNLHVGGHAGQNTGAPPSGPASPTPSGSEEPPTAQHSYHHSHHHHHHHSHSSHHQQQYQHAHHHNHHETTLAEQQQQQQQQQQHQHQHQQQKHQLHEQLHQIEPPQQQQQQQQVQVQQESSAVVVAEAVAAAEQRQRLLEDEIESLKLEQTRLAQQCADAQRREKILMRRLANKEQEFQDYVTQIAEYKAAQAPSAVALRSALLDPAVNLLFEKLKKELKATKAKLEETQNELSAWKFTPDSNTGKRLMAKCRLLYQENEELGKMTSNGRLAKLETELAMQKSFSEEVKKSQSELDDFLQELDEDVEGMQSTILFLQQELKTKSVRIQLLEKENYQLKNNELKESEVDAVAVNANSSDAHNIVTAHASPMHCNNIMSNNEPGNVTPYQVPVAASDYKYQLHKQQSVGGLETIEENECLRTRTDYYNGIGEEPAAPANMLQQPMTVPIAHAIAGMDDCGSSNSSNTSTPQLRTLAARKRNYEETCSVASGSPTECLMPAHAIGVALPTNAIPQTAMQQQQVSSPRTLPPKKSKLRITTSRSNEHLNELGHSEPTNANNNLYNSPTQTIAAGNTTIMDNAVAGMANEEQTSGALIIENTAPVPAEVIPQRIMTRRRSVRMQQNGNGELSH